jgi:lipopolysaccharide export LptBFGC system permease protein LptF
MITIYIALAFLFASSIFFNIKYFILRKGLKKYESIGTGKIGFYKIYDYYVYIKEIDRYTNGYSRIKIDFIDSNNSYYRNIIKKKFNSLVKTVNIEWLESEDNLKDIRKEKLNKLKKI